LDAPQCGNAKESVWTNLIYYQQQHGKQKAPRAIRELKALALKEMGTQKVLVKPSLNINLWKGGIRHVPHKMRIKITRKYDESEESSGDMISELDFVAVDDFKGLTTQKEA